jgi:CheY-like chemotaxis protein
MTGMDGFAVLKALRTGEKNRQTPVIFLTGQVSPEEIQAGQGLGVNDYLCKPATRQDILAAIYRQLGKRAGGI